MLYHTEMNANTPVSFYSRTYTIDIPYIVVLVMLNLHVCTKIYYSDFHKATITEVIQTSWMMVQTCQNHPSMMTVVIQTRMACV